MIQAAVTFQFQGTLDQEIHLNHSFRFGQCHLHLQVAVLKCLRLKVFKERICDLEAVFVKSRSQLKDLNIELSERSQNTLPKIRTAKV